MDVSQQGTLGSRLPIGRGFKSVNFGQYAYADLPICRHCLLRALPSTDLQVFIIGWVAEPVPDLVLQVHLNLTSSTSLKSLGHPCKYLLNASYIVA